MDRDYRRAQDTTWEEAARLVDLRGNVANYPGIRVAGLVTNHGMRRAYELSRVDDGIRRPFQAPEELRARYADIMPECRRCFVADLS